MRLGRQLAQQPRLAAAGLTRQHHDDGRARARPSPGGPQLRERLAPAHQRRSLGAQQRAGQRKSARLEPSDAGINAQLLGQRARLGRGRHAEPLPQRHTERLISGDRGGTVPTPRQAPHQHAGRVLRQRIQLEPAARVADRRLTITARLGGVTKRHQQLLDAITMQPALLEHPIVVQVGQQLAVPELERIVKAPLGDQTLGLPQIHPDLRALNNAHAVTPGDDVSGARPELAPQLRQRGPQARPSTGIKHIGPEHSSHPRTRMQTGVKRKPRKQRTRPPTRDRRQPAPAQLHTKVTDETDAQHLTGSLLAAVAPNTALRPACARTRGWQISVGPLARDVRGGTLLLRAARLLRIGLDRGATGDGRRVADRPAKALAHAAGELRHPGVHAARPVR